MSVLARAHVADPGQTDTVGERPVGRIDRVWADHWVGVLVTPVRMPSLDQVSALLSRAIESDPQMPLGCRLDDARARWVPVPAHERAAFVARAVRSIDDPDPDQADAFLAPFLSVPADGSPIRIGIGQRTLLLLVSHQVGDGATITALIRALLELDAEVLSSLADVSDLGAVWGAVRSLVPTHGRQWSGLALRRLVRWRNPGANDELPLSVARPAHELGAALPRLSVGAVRRSLGATTGRASSDSTATSPRLHVTPSLAVTTDFLGYPAGSLDAAPPQGPALVSVRWTNVEVDILSRWRARSAKNISMTTLLTALVHRGLREIGLPLRDDGHYGLFDIRRHLRYPASDQLVLGNCAKSLWLPADMGDLESIGRASQDAKDSARAAVSMLIGALGHGVHRSGTGRSDTAAWAFSDTAAPTQVPLTFSSMLALPNLTGLPWLSGEIKQYIPAGYRPGGDGVTVFALRLPDHWQVSAVVPRALTNGSSANPAGLSVEAIREVLQELPTAGP